MMEERVIKVFDITLRDGEQTFGVCLEARKKMEIAQAGGLINYVKEVKK